MNLNDAQKSVVASWIDGGAKLSEIQSRLASEMGLNLTYMEVRFLVDDLRLVLKDPEPRKSPEPSTDSTTQPAKPAPQVVNSGAIPSATPQTVASEVSVAVDHIARPGALVSGKVRFSDGQTADWTLDQLGRLGLAAQQKGYRPSAGDVEKFQIALQNELAKIGL